METDRFLRIETPRKSRSRWYFAGAAVALLLVAGVVAKTAPETLHISSPKNIIFDTEVSHWEDIPGIDKVIRKAQSLRHDKPLRNLQDLFYDSQPEEVPFIRTECVIDVVQAAAYLDQ
ncbi:unnamed protein product, partial [Symbiodinium sp. CCMP2456]